MNNSEEIIGQDILLNEVNNIFKIFKASNCAIRPHFILTGESGSGKSFTIKNMCLVHDLIYLEVNAAQLTKEGTSGNSLSKALSAMTNLSGKPVVVFVDEFDKLFISGNSNDSQAHESTTGVQNEFLKVLESDKSQVFGDYGKYLTVDMSKTLFVFAGAFNGEQNISIDRLREIGLKTEFLGRVGLVYNTKSLTLDELHIILKKSKLLYLYLELYDKITYEKAINDIGAYLAKLYEMNTLGARLINTLIHQYFIKGGLTDVQVKEISFQKKLTFGKQEEI